MSDSAKPSRGDRPSWLVIGIGNDLGGDDAAGRRVAAALAARMRPDVRILSLHQLAPEIVDHLRCCERVVFADADRSAEQVTLRPLAPADDEHPFGHLWSPHGLLALMQKTTGSAPQAWLVTLPARDLGFGSVQTTSACHVAEAVRLIEALMDSANAAGPHLEEATRTVGSGRSK